MQERLAAYHLKAKLKPAATANADKLLHGFAVIHPANTGHRFAHRSRHALLAFFRGEPLQLSELADAEPVNKARRHTPGEVGRDAIVEQRLLDPRFGHLLKNAIFAQHEIRTEPDEEDDRKDDDVAQTGRPLIQRLHDFLDHLLRVGKQHHGLVHVEHVIVDACITDPAH